LSYEHYEHRAPLSAGFNRLSRDVADANWEYDDYEHNATAVLYYHQLCEYSRFVVKLASKLLYASLQAKYALAASIRATHAKQHIPCLRMIDRFFVVKEGKADIKIECVEKKAKMKNKRRRFPGYSINYQGKYTGRQFLGHMIIKISSAPSLALSRSCCSIKYGINAVPTDTAGSSECSAPECPSTSGQRSMYSDSPL
jgi:hypothetical protein